MTTAAHPLAGTPVLLELSIQQALEWAFGRERARLDLDVDADPETRGQPSSMSAIFAAYMLLGTRIDSSGGAWGRSLPHHDAEVIAAFVANLPGGHGGRGMAIQIAECAAAGITPDWMPGARQRCVPREWRQTRYGVFARTEVVETIEVGHRGRRSRREILACPVTYTPTVAQIAAARRNYLTWIGALYQLQYELASSRMLTRIELNDHFPPMTPWRGRDVGAGVA